MSKEPTMGIIEQETHGARKEISKGKIVTRMATQSESRNKGITGERYLSKISTKRAPQVCISDMFVYTLKSMPLKSGHSKTVAYIDRGGRLDARFCMQGSQEDATTNDEAPTAQLQSLRFLLSIIAYRKWDVRVIDAHMGIPKV